MPTAGPTFAKDYYFVEMNVRHCFIGTELGACGLLKPSVLGRSTKRTCPRAVDRPEKGENFDKAGEDESVEESMMRVYLQRLNERDSRSRADLEESRKQRRRRSRNTPIPQEGLLGTQPRSSEPANTWWTVGRAGPDRDEVYQFVDGMSPSDAIRDEAAQKSQRARRARNKPGSQPTIQAGADLLNRDFIDEVETFLEKPIRRMSAGAISILLGYFCATSAATIIGSVADWDPLAAAVLIIWTEGFTRYYYRRDNKLVLLQMLNAFKVGLTYGMIVDSFKLCT